MAFTACKDTDAVTVEPTTASAVIGGEGNAASETDADGNTIITNLSDGSYAEWVIQLEGQSDYDIELDYSSANEEFNCTAEIYSEDGTLKADATLALKGTGSADTYETLTQELGELDAGMYTFIIRPDNIKPESINIKSVKLIP